MTLAEEVDRKLTNYRERAQMLLIELTGSHVPLPSLNVSTFYVSAARRAFECNFELGLDERIARLPLLPGMLQFIATGIAPEIQGIEVTEI